MSTYDVKGNPRFDAKLAAVFNSCCEKAWGLLRKAGLVLDTNLTNGGPIGLVSDDIIVQHGQAVSTCQKLSDILSPQEVDEIKRGSRPIRSLHDDATVRINTEGLEAEFDTHENYCVIDGVDVSERVISWGAYANSNGELVLRLTLKFEGDSLPGILVDGTDISEIVQGWNATLNENEKTGERHISVEVFPKHTPLKVV